jgi:hypothetical protein
MERNEEIELHELEVIEQNLSSHQPSDGESLEVGGAASPEGFMISSPSGFMIS